eukprot:1013324-Rhodomonas_salina.1
MSVESVLSHPSSPEALGLRCVWKWAGRGSLHVLQVASLRVAVEPLREPRAQARTEETGGCVSRSGAAHRQCECDCDDRPIMFSGTVFKLVQVEARSSASTRKGGTRKSDTGYVLSLNNAPVLSLASRKRNGRTAMRSARPTPSSIAGQE